MRCECGKSRRMHEATDLASFPLGHCRGARPWLGRHANEECREPCRLLIRTASNAWFPQVVSVLSLPEWASEVDEAVEELWNHLQIVQDANGLGFLKAHPEVANRLAPFSDEEVLEAIAVRRSGGTDAERPIKHVELDALLAVPEGYGDDVPIDPDFHARRLPESVWRRSARLDAVESVIQVHRLREVLSLAGFTRLEPVMPNVDGEYESDVERADIALEPAWFPAVENRGEGILLELRSGAVADWLDRDVVKRRLDELNAGHLAWARDRSSERPFPGGPYILLNIERRRGDTTAADSLVRQFADEFWGREWPGTARPKVYYDPRSVETDSPGGVLHAKAVVADEESVFITSANLTAAAQDRNIELGLVVRDRALAATTVTHFRTLIEKDLLRRLPDA